MFASDKVGDTMTVAMRRADAKEWFGVAPPDLSVIARSRGADWLYAYLRSSIVTTEADRLEQSGVSQRRHAHVLWELQGQQVLKLAEAGEGHGKHKVETPGPGKARRADAAASSTSWLPIW